MPAAARTELGHSSRASEAIACFAANQRSSDLPTDVIHAAKRSLIDAIGVSLAASGLGDECTAFHRLAQSGGAGPCTALGWGDGISLDAALMLNGALAHAIDFENVLDASPIHPDACAVAAALAVAESLGSVSGLDLLAAIAVGGDIVCRLSLALRTNPEASGWYTPPILGAYGATAAVARLIGLSAEQTHEALALTLAQVTCTNQFKSSPRSSLRAIRDAFATRDGATAARLAALGVAGFDEPLEGRAGLFALYANGDFNSDALTDDLGAKFHGPEVSFKAWPACRGTHAFIEAALAIRSQPSFSIDDVVAVEAQGSSFLNLLTEPKDQKAAPQTAIDAKFSIPFSIATTLCNGAPGLVSYNAAALADPKTLRLAALTRFTALGGDFRDASAGTVVVSLRGGAQLRHRVDFAFGHPTNPIDDAALAVKFRDCVRLAAVPPDSTKIEQLLIEIDGLAEDRGNKGSKLLSTLYPRSYGEGQNA